MMKGDEIPSSHHIARYCKPTDISPITQELMATAFYLRENIDEYLSTNWLEFFERSSTSDAIDDIRNIFIRKMRSIPAKAQFAVLNIEKMCTYVKTKYPDHRVLRVVHEPDETNGVLDESHCGIYDMKDDYRSIAELILQTIDELYPARG
jgi:hypothetical protein